MPEELSGPPSPDDAYAAVDPRIATVEPPSALSPGDVPAFYKRRSKRSIEICQLLIGNCDVTPQDVRQGLRIQEERGGQIGRILVQMGACSERTIARALIKQVQLARELGRANTSHAARENPEIAGLQVACSPRRTIAVMALSDLASLASTAAIGIFVHLLAPSVGPHEYMPEDGHSLRSQLVALARRSHPGAHPRRRFGGHRRLSGDSNDSSGLRDIHRFSRTVIFC